MKHGQGAVNVPENGSGARKSVAVCIYCIVCINCIALYLLYRIALIVLCNFQVQDTLQLSRPNGDTPWRAGRRRH